MNALIGLRDKGSRPVQMFDSFYSLIKLKINVLGWIKTILTILLEEWICKNNIFNKLTAEWYRSYIYHNVAKTRGFICQTEHQIFGGFTVRFLFGIDVYWTILSVANQYTVTNFVLFPWYISLDHCFLNELQQLD